MRSSITTTAQTIEKIQQ